jgi:hypothetical protein
MDKPKIAIVNTSSQLASCFSHLDSIVPALKAAIQEAGGVAFEVRTAAPSDAITSAGAAGQYILPTRDLIASDIEVAVEGALLDGMVCLASCDKTTPGQLMAAGRLNIPAIIVACGYQPSGVYRGEPVDFEDIFRFAGHVAAGVMSSSGRSPTTRRCRSGAGQGGALAGVGGRRRPRRIGARRGRGGADRLGPARLPRHGPDLGADVRAGRGGLDHVGGGHHRRPDIRPGQRRPRDRGGLP